MFPDYLKPACSQYFVILKTITYKRLLKFWLRSSRSITLQAFPDISLRSSPSDIVTFSGTSTAIQTWPKSLARLSNLFQITWKQNVAILFSPYEHWAKQLICDVTTITMLCGGGDPVARVTPHVWAGSIMSLRGLQLVRWSWAYGLGS
jgi:hypothetical protein